MTLSTSVSVASSIGNGVTTAFSVPFTFYENSHIVITVAGVVKVLNTDYTLIGAGVDGGGTATFTVAPALGAEVVRTRIVPYTQETDLENFDGNPADVTEKQFDLCVMQAQQLSEYDSRSLHYPVGDIASSELPSKADRASKYLAFDANGEPIAANAASGGGGGGSDLTVSAFMETVLDDGTAVDARSTLGAAASAQVATYTAAVTCATSGTVTLDSASDTLAYILHGDNTLCTVTGRLTVASVSSPVGILRISLPPDFPADDLTKASGVCSASIVVDNTVSANAGNISATIGESGTYISCYISSGTALTAGLAQQMKATTDIFVYVTYRIPSYLVPIYTGSGAALAELLAVYLASLTNSYLEVITPGNYTFDGTKDIVGFNKTTSEATTVTVDVSELTDGKKYIIKDVKGDCDTYNITITPDSGTIEGASSYVLNNPFQAVTFFKSGTKLIAIG